MSKELEDSWVFPFGKYKGKAIVELPADYLDWIDGQTWIENYPDIVAYIARNRDRIDRDLKRMGKI